MYREQQLRTLLAGRRILIAGYGREGQSAERLVRTLLPDTPPAVATQVENGRWKDPDGQWHADWPFDLVIKSPGIPNFQFPILNFQLTSLTDLFLQVYADLTIGVTGTKGKSTTASLIAHLIPGSILAGNIGIPLFDIVEQLDEHSVVVAELSCHQLEVLHRSPHISIVLNLFQEHLDHYPDYMAYKMAKLQIALHQQPSDHFFYCADNSELRDLVQRLAPDMKGQLHPYSLSDLQPPTSALRPPTSALRPPTSALPPPPSDLLASFPLPGDHNRSNALVACRVAQLITRQPLSTFNIQLSTFTPLRHRMERVGLYRGITWYNDSISTIPEAAIAAIRALGRVDTLILGGFDRGIDYSPLVEFLNEHPMKNIVFVGAAGRRIKEHINLSTYQPINCIVEDDYSKIVPWCAEHTPQGGVVLLSPAAASYDSFKNFEARGDCFRDQILKL